MSTLREHPLLEPTFLAKLDRLSLVSRRMHRGQIQGERRSPNKGASVEFSDFRTYTHGDDFRQIDWNAYARLERLFVKLFVAEEDLTIHILLDASQSMAWGEPDKWHFARRLAAALGYIALAGLDRVTAVALTDASHKATDRFRPHRGKRQALAWLDWLAGLQPSGDLDPDTALRDYRATTRQPGPLLVISDLLGPGWESGLQALAGGRFDVTLLHLLAPQEVSPVLEGDFHLIDSENGAAVEITADYDLLQRYRQRLADWQGHLQQVCASIDARYIFLQTTTPLEDLVLAYLRHYDVVR